MRIIGKIEIKDKYVIKPVQFEGLRKIGNPEDIINNFYNDNFDEILIYNVTGSLYGIGWIKKFVEQVLKKTCCTFHILSFLHVYMFLSVVHVSFFCRFYTFHMFSKVKRAKSWKLIA